MEIWKQFNVFPIIKKQRPVGYDNVAVGAFVFWNGI
jgi:hypothetical protein